MEQLNNPHFKGVEFDTLLYEAGSKNIEIAGSRALPAAEPKSAMLRPIPTLAGLTKQIEKISTVSGANIRAVLYAMVDVMQDSLSDG